MIPLMPIIERSIVYIPLIINKKITNVKEYLVILSKITYNNNVLNNVK